MQHFSKIEMDKKLNDLLYAFSIVLSFYIWKTLFIKCIVINTIYLIYNIYNRPKLQMVRLLFLFIIYWHQPFNF